MSRRWAPGGTRQDQSADPFRALGLQRGAELADDDVRAAWRAMAAATHPDRTDGGDPAAFAAAASGYARLRTPAGRAEALADDDPAGPARIAGSRWPRWPRSAEVRGAARVSRRRPGRLVLRFLAAVAAGVLAVLAVGWQPASVAVITGALTWLALTGRLDLAP
jgi:hypothetical protein